MGALLKKTSIFPEFSRKFEREFGGRDPENGFWSCLRAIDSVGKATDGKILRKKTKILNNT